MHKKIRSLSVIIIMNMLSGVFFNIMCSVAPFIICDKNLDRNTISIDRAHWSMYSSCNTVGVMCVICVLFIIRYSGGKSYISDRKGQGAVSGRFGRDIIDIFIFATLSIRSPQSNVKTVARSRHELK